MMNETLVRMKNEAKAILALQNRPRFYNVLEQEIAYCRSAFFEQPILLRLQEDVIPFLYDDYGHGIDHSKKVAIEAGAIILAEAGAADRVRARKQALLAQMAGLLHDICRLEEHHALRGAELSDTILADYPLSQRDKELIAFAISDHEAFQPRRDTDDVEAELLSGALYDADKFRWGPDNFSTTLWEMCDYNDVPIQDIVALFPSGVKRIQEISATFRTEIGKTFGPEFIELGLKMASDVYRRLDELAGKQS